MGSKSTEPRVKLGAWLVQAVNTVYQAVTDGFVYAYSVGGSIGITGQTDSLNPPVTKRNGNGDATGDPCSAGIAMAVKKNDYWKVTYDAVVPAVYWIPLE